MDDLLELTDREYYADPYGPLDPPEHEAYMNSGYDEDLLAYRDVLFDNDWDEEDNWYEDAGWDEGDLTEAQYQDRSWDEYEDEVFYNSEDLEDD